MTEEQRTAALSRIGARKAFWRHLAVYVIVNVFMVVIWALGDGGSFWPGWVMFGWGIGVAFNAFNVFVGQRPISEESIQREIDKGS